MNKEATPRKEEHVVMIKRVMVLLLLLFLVVYFISVLVNASDFFAESATANALLAIEEDAASADKLARVHFQNLEEIATRLATADTKEEVDAIVKEYIGSEHFGDLRYYVGEQGYSPDGAEVLEDPEEVHSLAVARKQGVTDVYFDTVVELDCVAFFLPLPSSSYADGILSIVPARNLIALNTVRNQKSVVAALITLEGRVLGNAMAEGFSYTLGNDFSTFLASFTDDKQVEGQVIESLHKGERAAYVLPSLEGEYCIALSRMPVLDNDILLVSISENEALIESEMAFIRHILVVLILATAAFVATVVYSVLYHKQAAKELSQATLTDPTLDVPNVEQFRRNAREVVYSDKRQFAVAVCVLRQHHFIIETLGEQKANEVLKLIAKVYETFCTAGECYGYAGEGKFLLLYRYFSAKELKEKLRLVEAIINKSDLIKEAKIAVKFNIGVYLTSQGKRRTLPEMIDCATIASESAKANITAPYILYTEEVNSEIAKNERIEAQMEEALLNGEFKLFLQPKYNVQHDRIDSAEALVRWFDPSKGEYRFPAAFIGLFETNGFIVKLDRFVYLEVLKYLDQATQRGDKIVPISVNVSRVTAMSDSFLDFYIGNKQKYGIGDGFITLELTESFALENYEKIRDIVDSLHKNGIKCAIDDFGSGYSSFNVLKQIPFDELKIDRLFLEQGIDRDRDNVIIEAVVQLAKQINVSVVQEGVETEEMFRRVVAMGCEVVQGYYYAKAIPLEEYKIFIKSNTSIKYKAKVK